MTTSFRWMPNEADNALVTHLRSGMATEASIRELLARGANINAVAEGGYSVLMHAIEFTQDGTGTELIAVLIHLGANVNHQVDGFGPLYSACLIAAPDLVELLLSHGANPNVILEGEESLLDDVDFDRWYHESQGPVGFGPEGHPSGCPDHRCLAERHARIFSLLERAGAKRTDEIRAEAISDGNRKYPVMQERLAPRDPRSPDYIGTYTPPAPYS